MILIYIASKADICEADLVSLNGVVHKIDTVLLPFGSLSDVIAKDDDLSILNDALKETDYDNALNVFTDIYTVLAPNDNAFDALLNVLGINSSQLLKNTELLNLVLPYHVISNKFLSYNLTYGQEIETLSNGKLIVNIDDDLDVSFIDDEGTFVNVIQVDVPSLNGVLHKISQVLLPSTAITSSGSIVNALYRFDSLSTLRDAVVIAKLLRILGTTSPLTVLAPTNTAFSILDISLDNIISNVTLLTQLLQYHVISGNITSNDLIDGTKVTTLNNETLTVIKDDASIQFMDALGNIAAIITPNIFQTNGVIHIIDTVLSLASINATSALSEYGYTELTVYLNQTGLDGVIDDGEFTIFGI